MTKYITLVTYGSFDNFIKGSSESFGCSPDVFREVYDRHKHKNDGSNEDSFKVVFGYMDELKSMGYERR